jgi:hypothetical protein
MKAIAMDTILIGSLNNKIVVKSIPISIKEKLLLVDSLHSLKRFNLKKTLN